jgi:hypothetical protein
MEPVEHKAKMKPRAEAPEGLETDGKGNVIPLDQRTPEDQARAAGQGLKNPDHEAEVPAPMPNSKTGSPQREANDDPAGQQGGQRGGGRDNSPPQP